MSSPGPPSSTSAPGPPRSVSEASPAADALDIEPDIIALAESAVVGGTVLADVDRHHARGVADRIKAVAAADHVCIGHRGARARNEYVVSWTTEKSIVAELLRALNDAERDLGTDRVVARAPVLRVVAIAPDQAIRPIATLEDVGAASALELVGARAAVDPIGATCDVPR